MSPTVKIILISAACVYLMLAVVIVNKSMSTFAAKGVFSDLKKTDTRKMISFEKALQRKFKIPDSKVALFLIWERSVAAVALLLFLWFFQGIAAAVIGAFIIGFFFDQAYKGVIEESGVNSIPELVNFINNFIPRLTAGESADQAFLSYVNQIGSEDLLEYYSRQDDLTYIPKNETDSQIIEIYNVAKYNESIGSDDYISVLQEILKDINQKQKYYNSFKARIGEAKPIAWAYYIGVPVMIGIGFSYTKEFWFGLGGWFASIALLLLFLGFKFFLYKVQKKSVLTIF